MRAYKLFLGIILLAILAGCQLKKTETMVLLNEKVGAVHVSKSGGFGGINEDAFLTFTDSKAINVIIQAITTAERREGIVNMATPNYDLLIDYEAAEGNLPKHAIHLWLGEVDQGSSLMYLEDDHTVYSTTPEITKKLRDLILIDE